MRLSDRTIRFRLKPVVFLASLGPFGWLAWAGLTGNLSANPLSDLTLETGVWTIRFVCITLALTPLRRLTGWNPFIRFRRMAGLFAFFYGSLHFLTYAIADRFASLDFPDGMLALRTVRDLLASIGEDIYKRPYITVGFTAFVLMVPLTITSTAAMIRRLGGKRWNQIHRLIYITAILAVVHYYWLVKADVQRPIVYGMVVGALLGFRLWWSRAKTTRARASRRRARAWPVQRRSLGAVREGS